MVQVVLEHQKLRQVPEQRQKTGNHYVLAKRDIHLNRGHHEYLVVLWDLLHPIITVKS